MLLPPREQVARWALTREAWSKQWHFHGDTGVQAEGLGNGQCPVSTGRVSSDLPWEGRPQDSSQGKEGILRPLWLLPVGST